MRRGKTSRPLSNADPAPHQNSQGVFHAINAYCSPLVARSSYIFTAPCERYRPELLAALVVILPQLAVA